MQTYDGVGLVMHLLIEHSPHPAEQAVLDSWGLNLVTLGFCAKVLNTDVT